MRTRQAGFTLLEVLVAMSIAGLVFATVSTAFVVSLQASGDTTRLLTDSQGGAFASAYFTRDVQSAKTLLPGGTTCPSASGSPVASMTWEDKGVSPTASYLIDYRIVGSAPAAALVRTSCGVNPGQETIAGGLISAMVTCATPACASVDLMLQGAGGSTFSTSVQRRLS